MNALSAEREELKAVFESEPPLANIVALHPAVLERYAGQLARLQDALAGGSALATRKGRW